LRPRTVMCGITVVGTHIEAVHITSINASFTQLKIWHATKKQIADNLEQTSSECGGSRDDFDQLHGDSCLSCLVVLKVELINDLLGILRGVLHSAHSCTLFRGGVVQECNP